MTDLFLQFWPYIVAVGAAVFGAWKIRQSGVNAERAKQAASETRARDVADQVDNDLGTLTPAQARERLQKWSKQ